MGSEDDDKAFGASRKIMLFAVLSLFCAVLLVVFLYLYSRYLLRSEERRRHLNNLYRINRQIAPDNVNDQTGSESGLDPLIISSLPTFKYKTIDHVDHTDSMECSICLGTLVEDAMVKVLPNCKHLFHVECIDLWFGSHTTCPICRTMAEPTVVQEEVNTEPSDRVIRPSAPPLEESTSHGGSRLEKVNSSSSSRFGSFRRMFSRGSLSRTRSFGDEIIVNDIERQ